MTGARHAELVSVSLTNLSYVEILKQVQDDWCPSMMTGVAQDDGEVAKLKSFREALNQVAEHTKIDYDVFDKIWASILKVLVGKGVVR